MQRLVQDVKRLWRHAALIGAVLAVLCKLLPPEYRALCQAIVAACIGSAEGNP